MHVKETVQIQNMNKCITKAPVKTEDGFKDKLYMESYVELINYKFVFPALVVESAS